MHSGFLVDTAPSRGGRVRQTLTQQPQKAHRNVPPLSPRLSSSTLRRLVQCGGGQMATFLPFDAARRCRSTPCPAERPKPGGKKGRRWRRAAITDHHNVGLSGKNVLLLRIQSERPKQRKTAPQSYRWRLGITTKRVSTSTKKQHFERKLKILQIKLNISRKSWVFFFIILKLYWQKPSAEPLEAISCVAHG